MEQQASKKIIVIHLISQMHFFNVWVFKNPFFFFFTYEMEKELYLLVLLGNINKITQ